MAKGIFPGSLSCCQNGPMSADGMGLVVVVVVVAVVVVWSWWWW